MKNKHVFEIAFVQRPLHVTNTLHSECLQALFKASETTQTHPFCYKDADGNPKYLWERRAFTGGVIAHYLGFLILECTSEEFEVKCKEIHQLTMIPQILAVKLHEISPLTGPVTD